MNQFQTSEGSHSDNSAYINYGAIDVQYVAKAGTEYYVQAETQDGNVDKNKSKLLADLFVKFGFNGNGKWNVLTEGDNKTALFEGTAYTDGHHNHMHVQKYNFNHITIHKPVSITPNINFTNQIGDIWKPNYDGERANSKNATWRRNKHGTRVLYRIKK